MTKLVPEKLAQEWRWLAGMEMVCTNIHALFGVLSFIHIVLDLLLLIIIIISLSRRFACS